MDTNLPPQDSATPPPLTPPPPIAPPPVITAPRPAPATKKGRGWMVVALVLLVLLGLSALLNLSNFASSFTTVGHERLGGPQLDEVTLEDNDASAKIAVIRVEGIIASQTDSGYDLVQLIQDQLDRAADDKHVKAVVLKVEILHMNTNVNRSI